MSADESQSITFIRNNIAKVVDASGNFYGSAFLLNLEGQNFCITCHHCINKLEKIIVQNNSRNYSCSWVKEFSDMSKDIAVLRLDANTIEPLRNNLQAVPKLSVITWGFSGAKLKNFPKGLPAQSGNLSDDLFPIEWEAEESTGKNEWNNKPKVSINVFQYNGKFELGFSGAPVCYIGDNKVVGIFEAIDENNAYVIPIQTLLEIFKSNRPSSTTSSQSIKITDTPPTDMIKAILKEGNRFLEEEKYSEAVNEYDKIIYDPNYGDAIFNKAYTFGEFKRYDEAKEWYSIFLKINPNDGYALGNMGYMFFNQGSHAEAIKWYDMALGTKPKDNMLLKDILIGKGLSLYNIGWYKEAIESFDKVLELNPNDSDTLGDKGAALNGLARFNEAIVMFDKALDITPEQINVIGNKGLALSELGRYEEATKCYDKVLELDPNDTNALGNKGLIQDNLGRYEEALKLYDKALAIDPNHVNNIALKVLTLARLGKDEVDKYAKMILAINPNYAVALYNIGLSYSIIGKVEKALQWYDKSLSMDPFYIKALDNKGLTLIRLGRYKEASNWYDEVLEKYPKDIYVLNNKGWSLHLQGNYQDALQWYDKSLSIDPNYDYAINNKKDALEKLENKRSKKI